MTSPRDYYAILGVRPSASGEEIRGAFRRMSMAYHPDLNKSPGAAERMKEINAAYDTLSDPAKRAEYDLALDRAARSGAGASSSWRESPSQPRRGANVRVGISLTWAEALHGTELELHLNGRWLVVDIPAGIRDGTTLRLNGQGEPGANGGRPGDALVSVRVEYPVSAYYSEEYAEPEPPPRSSPEPAKKRSDSDGCGCGAAAIVAVIAVTLIWILSNC